MSEKRETFSVRAPDPVNRGKWISVGFAWKRDDGGMNVKLNSVPVAGGWDGGLVVLPPLKQEDDPQ